ncbi:hypothetical protein CAPTEDRAFT_199127 [Capitella teleta]|uniref:L-Fucosyltransferase n=1 Tax=Capitella teleta TaxID=283909 RepID=R7VE70_CAPTE|nr:hypothetical protein CAPTEDRAFT_199127 [Capitella teleta]|eukprot:ELU13975.1 hypothetical protein CAPTEDRAFT_199127 [Capitella teleta]
MKENYQNMRYTFPGRSFFENSIQFFADADPNLHVVVCCVDIEWCRSNLTDLPATFYFSESKNVIVDLAIMSMGEHAIMTTGTFGWWGAWLANGETVYYSNWPRHGSQMVQIRYVRQDFFMPHWIGINVTTKSTKWNPFADLLLPGNAGKIPGVNYRQLHRPATKTYASLMLLESFFEGSD